MNLVKTKIIFFLSFYYKWQNKSHLNQVLQIQKDLELVMIDACIQMMNFWEDSDFNFNSSDEETDSDTESDVGEEEALNVNDSVPNADIIWQTDSSRISFFPFTMSEKLYYLFF